MSISISVRKRLSPDASRAAAVAAARDLLTSEGVAAVTLKAVAARIGRTHANLLHHFGSVAGLHAALARDIARVGRGFDHRVDRADAARRGAAARRHRGNVRRLHRAGRGRTHRVGRADAPTRGARTDRRGDRPGHPRHQRARRAAPARPGDARAGPARDRRQPGGKRSRARLRPAAVGGARHCRAAGHRRAVRHGFRRTLALLPIEAVAFAMRYEAAKGNLSLCCVVSSLPPCCSRPCPPPRSSLEVAAPVLSPTLSADAALDRFYRRTARALVVPGDDACRPRVAWSSSGSAPPQHEGLAEAPGARRADRCRARHPRRRRRWRPTACCRRA